MDAIAVAQSVPGLPIGPEGNPLVDIILGQGLMGVIVVALVYFILMLRAELRDVRAAHKTEIAAKEALIYQLQEDRLKESRIGFDIASSNKSALEALLSAIRKGP